MGLDMYLERETYVKNWPHQEHQYEVTGHARKSFTCRESQDPCSGANVANADYLPLTPDR